MDRRMMKTAALAALLAFGLSACETRKAKDEALIKELEEEIERVSTEEDGAN